MSKRLTRCDFCGYHWADCDFSGEPISLPYCHFDGPPEWAPCEQDNDFEMAINVETGEWEWR